MRILASLFLLLSTSVLADGANLNVSNVVGIGGIQGMNNTTQFTINSDLFVPIGSLTATSKIKTLVSNLLGTISVETWLAFIDPSTGAQYQVPNGKTFTPIKVCMSVTATNGFNGTIGSATATFTHGTNTEPTGSSYFGGGAVSARPMILSGVPAAGGTVDKCISFPFVSGFLANSYPFFNTSVSSNANVIYLVGIEQ